MEYILKIVLLVVGLGVVIGQNVDGGWGPWENNPDVDCCMYGGYEKRLRSCNNPLPEGTGKCTTSNGTLAVTEEQWLVCNCSCSPLCDGVTAFCANDTGTAAYCACVYGLVPIRDADPNILVVCVSKDDPRAAVPAPNEMMDNFNSSLDDLLDNGVNSMDADDKKIIEIVEKVMILWVVCWCGAVLILFFTMCHFRCDRILHMQQEISLIILCILIAGLSEEESAGEGLCKLTSILLHYFVMVLMTFFCLEALHTYSLVTYIVPKDGFFIVMINLAIGYGFPIVPLGISVGVLQKDYGTSGFHCWCNLDTNQSWAFIFPIILLGFICTVIAEAQGQGKYKELPDSDISQYTSAKVSQGSLMLIMPTAALAYIMGLLAIHFQEIAIYVLFILLCFVLGPLVFFFHCIGNEKIRAMLQKMCPCLPCLKEKPPPQPINDGMMNDGYEPNQDDMYGEGPPLEDRPGPSPPPQRPQSNDKDQEDTDWRQFYKWVSDGKKDNVKQGGDILFQE